MTGRAPGSPAPDPDAAARISVVIPTYNGEAWLERLLAMLAAQSRPPDEILVIDSGSTDATPALVAASGARLLTIPKETFDHGGTRTLAARETSGDILVYLTQDAIPADRQALERLVQPLLDNTAVAATYGRQLANADANPFSAHLRLFNYPAEGAVRCRQDRQRLGFKTIFISNSFAAYRRQALAEVGFFPEKLLFGEDTCTVARLMDRGHCVEYVSTARVYHSHNYSLQEDFRRYFDIGVLHAREWPLLRTYGTPTGAGKQFVMSEISFLCREKKSILVPLSLLRNGLKLVAYALGRRHRRLPRRLARMMSMHPLWWD